MTVIYNSDIKGTVTRFPTIISGWSQVMHMIIFVRESSWTQHQCLLHDASVDTFHCSTQGFGFGWETYSRCVIVLSLPNGNTIQRLPQCSTATRKQLYTSNGLLIAIQALLILFPAVCLSLVLHSSSNSSRAAGAILLVSNYRKKRLHPFSMSPQQFNHHPAAATLLGWTGPSGPGRRSSSELRSNATLAFVKHICQKPDGVFTSQLNWCCVCLIPLSR